MKYFADEISNDVSYILKPQASGEVGKNIFLVNFFVFRLYQLYVKYYNYYTVIGE